MGAPLEGLWKAVNPLTRPIAGYAPWWVLLETTGRRTGVPRLTPLATGPFDGSSLAVLSVYGEESAFVRNIRANPDVRLKRRGRWLDATAEVNEATPAAISQLGSYARRILLRLGTDPKVVVLNVAPRSP